MASIRAPATKKTTTLTVAVKCRPLTERERGRNIVRVHDDKEILLLDPDLSKDYLDRVQNRSKERRYTFDYAFGPDYSNSGVYERSVRSTIVGVVQGLNATVFAYGSTGSGKTYTMVGTQDDPGLMVLSLNTIFDLIEEENCSDDFEVTCSYLEVYNEVIYDLLEKSSGHLELRENPEQGILVAGLRRIKVNSADRILELLNLGNSRRKTESTEVNGTSSRSHAVLEISVTRKQHKQYPKQIIRGKLALVDLAGSERASETNNAGQKLRDGANINRSLLALANCINALGKQQKKGLAYVPYRNSKLTRILKDGLSGNSQTIMVATISPADNQYHHTVNTLKYADRAKEIKTHIQKNIGTINAPVSDYQKIIDNLQSEVGRLRKELAEKESQLNSKHTERSPDDEISWLNSLSQETSENVLERINLQKALIELEETNLCNRKELQHLDDAIAKQQVIENDGAVVQALQARRQMILDNIRDNDELGVGYQKEIEANEQCRCQLQDMIDEAIRNNGNKTYLSILSQYRLLGISNTELQFEIAIRDQIINSQREAQRNLWNLLTSFGLNEKQIVELGAKQGITVEDFQMTPPADVLSNMKYEGNNTPLHCTTFKGQPCALSPCFFPQDRELSSRCFPHAFFREELHASYYYVCHGSSPPGNQQWQSGSCYGVIDGTGCGLLPYDQSVISASSYGSSCRARQQDALAVTNRKDINMKSYVGTSTMWDPCKVAQQRCTGTARVVRLWALQEMSRSGRDSHACGTASARNSCANLQVQRLCVASSSLPLSPVCRPFAPGRHHRRRQLFSMHNPSAAMIDYAPWRSPAPAPDYDIPRRPHCPPLSLARRRPPAWLRSLHSPSTVSGGRVCDFILPPRCHIHSPSVNLNCN
ncbi:P-loop containing nucleoside triphosphate hydrolases superfamily protein [Striga hermonthica]|uniref:Kinesin-like protein n=1 Tax=Striga hermonthica TaxID=68872 RepID=A0A9N7P1Z4_STRHE|nr:P-loop containing nucleoside triphosphate hydrolases superfamily protein [Striga hermonthica]